jgi:Fe-S cluster assembly iron-binding protein IscA
MENISVKQEAQRIVEELAEDATWDDLMYRIYVRQAIESGLQDSEANRTLDVSEVRARFGLKP